MRVDLPYTFSNVDNLNDFGIFYISLRIHKYAYLF